VPKITVINPNDNAYITTLYKVCMGCSAWHAQVFPTLLVQ
jgi:hypothetical protein